jgi:curved DNA-binding protein CbpA
MSDAEELDQLDYYSLLGIEPTATDDELRRAFRKFALRYHPDRYAGAPEDKIARATAIYRRGSEAVEVLGDPVQRRAYDAALARGETRLTAEPTKKAAAKSSRPSARRTGRSQRPHTTARTIQSPSARAYYARAIELAKAGDHRGAYQAIQNAIQQEPGNPLLEEALAKVRQYIR